MRRRLGGLTPGKVFNAVPIAVFSAPAELTPKIMTFVTGLMESETSAQKIKKLKHPRRPETGFLRSPLGKAKPSLMVAATVPASSSILPYDWDR
jgi:hypothetical protein